jgi:hypothetical protein
MILGFKDQFVDKILAGTKIHTVRESGRFTPGVVIHFATGVRTKNYHQFKEGVCMYAIPVTIMNYRVTINPVWNDSIYLNVEEFSQNDGFDSVDDFFKWFDKPFSGHVIGWTKNPYEKYH